MKKRDLLRALRREQRLTRRALHIIILMYRDEENAEDSAPSAPIKKPDIHAVIEPIKGDEFLRHFQ